jgi:hypothetical protein
MLLRGWETFSTPSRPATATARRSMAGNRPADLIRTGANADLRGRVVSYDVEVWAPQPFQVQPASLPDPSRWEGGEGEEGVSWAYEPGSWWHIVIDPPRALEDDEELQEFGPPDAVLAVQANVGHMVNLSLEPIGAPEEGYKQLYEVGPALASAVKGVCYDPQLDQVIPPPQRPWYAFGWRRRR